MILENRLRKMEERMSAIETELSDPNVVKDQAKFQKLSKELAHVRPIIETFHQYLRADKEAADLTQSLSEKNVDEEFKKLCEEEKQILEKKKQDLQARLEDMLLQESDENVSRDVIVEIRAGTGGEEAALFAADLFRMYSQYAVAHELTVEVMSSSTTGKGGFKELIFGISGTHVYPLFKYESGIHRVQRVPETEASGRVHTSAVTVAVLPEADDTEIAIEPKDLRIDVFRASGAGGQHVNKTESAVRITHVPTGFVVSCQDERSQHKNKVKAMRVLRARLYEMQQLQRHKEMADERKKQVGSGDRSGKIRTYNFQDNRVTDHRIGLTLHALDDILDGHLDDVVQALAQHERMQKLTNAA